MDGKLPFKFKTVDPEKEPFTDGIKPKRVDGEKAGKVFLSPFKSKKTNTAHRHSRSAPDESVMIASRPHHHHHHRHNSSRSKNTEEDRRISTPRRQNPPTNESFDEQDTDPQDRLRFEENPFRGVSAEIRTGISSSSFKAGLQNEPQFIRIARQAISRTASALKYTWLSRENYIPQASEVEREGLKSNVIEADLTVVEESNRKMETELAAWLSVIDKNGLECRKLPVEEMRNLCADVEVTDTPEEEETSNILSFPDMEDDVLFNSRAYGDANESMDQTGEQSHDDIALTPFREIISVLDENEPRLARARTKVENAHSILPRVVKQHQRKRLMNILGVKEPDALSLAGSVPQIPESNKQ